MDGHSDNVGVDCESLEALDDDEKWRSNDLDS